MKRLIPLWITALGGFVLIVAYFIPRFQGWGEVAAIWFDILAAIAFILGGGNLLKIHLKKMSDRGKGWGYSLVTLLAFLLMLAVGLLKLGAPPASNQEFYGQTFVSVPLESLPAALTFSEPGTIPERHDGEPLHASVRQQISEENGNITFRGWMRPGQKIKLLEHNETLAWQCAVEKLYTKSQPPEPLRSGKTKLVAYYVFHDALSFQGSMTAGQRDLLKGLEGADPAWGAAVDSLYQATERQTSVVVNELPPLFGPDRIARTADLAFDEATGALTVTGPLTPGRRSALTNLVFPVARPMDQAAADTLLAEISELGPVHERQEVVFRNTVAGLWPVDLLVIALNAAGLPRVEDRAACACLADQQAGMAEIPIEETVGGTVALNDAQVRVLRDFAGAEAPMSVPDLLERLTAAGPLKDEQIEALFSFMSSQPSEADFARNLCFAMMKATDLAGTRLSLNAEQVDFLLKGARRQARWNGSVDELFVTAHVVKFRWSGEYRAQGTIFWWLYEYAFKPLQATIFAMLAFYVASAAFRAFRAKNVEAILLLGTAFIILLGRTYAGVALTAWMPESLSGLRIENLTVTIMKVFNTAGNRAIMIGIALGISSTSLKVLLGVDRSYLGSGEE